MRNKKYKDCLRNRLKPKLGFYTLYNNAQIYEIVDSLEVNCEIPRQYNYLGNGARSWSDYMDFLLQDKEDNILYETISLLQENNRQILEHIPNSMSVNVIDVGAGNGYPVKKFLQYLIDQRKLYSYTALDISPSMLKIIRENISSWFELNMNFQYIKYDFNKDRLYDFLPNRDATHITKERSSIILILGGTFSNLRNVDKAYRNIHSGMRIGRDLLIHIAKLDNVRSRNYFNFNSRNENELSRNHTNIFDLINLKRCYYDVEVGYDDVRNERYIRVRLKISLCIDFIIEGRAHSVYLFKGTRIVLWHATQHVEGDIINQLRRNNFDVVHRVRSNGGNYLMTISKAVDSAKC